ncbi:MAG TPA: DegT/DnrJ/EryC1/StrS family aminotransferase [Firmicutes bacterium]|nr:DegT/DnrJ/EryC1/StrS family aminotransferase [Bacillota bacterium]
MAKLAINGGPSLGAGYKVQWPIITQEDEQAVLQAVRLNQLGGLGDENTHPNFIFERQFAAYHSARYGVIMANGTVTLETALRACGVQPGDEVLVPAITFVASASAIVSVGAVPVFVDVDETTCQISPTAAAQAITTRTKAIIAVHYGAYCFDIDALSEIARQHHLALIEDCAHAQGTFWKGRGVGSWGTCGSFSFQHSKSLVGGEGGIVITDDTDLFERISLLRNIGRRTGQTTYGHYISASNCRLGGLQGAFLLSQFQRFPEQAKMRHENVVWLEEQLRTIPGIEVTPPEPRLTQRGCYFLVLKFDPEAFGCSRSQFVAAMHAEGVNYTSTGYDRPLYKEPAFARENLRGMLHPSITIPAYNELRLPNAEMWAARQVTISHRYLSCGSRTGAELVFNAICKIKENVGELAVGGER